jgi:hypothetical protein
MPSLIGKKEIPGSEGEVNIIVGDATVGPVRKEVWEYEVNGMHVIRHWFDSRQRAPLHKKSKKGLMAVNYGSWTQDLDSELLAMLSVLNGCVQLEPRQSRLLDQVCSANTITTGELLQMQILPVPSASTKGPSPRQFGTPALPGI